MGGNIFPVMSTSCRELGHNDRNLESNKHKGLSIECLLEFNSCTVGNVYVFEGLYQAKGFLYYPDHYKFDQIFI